MNKPKNYLPPNVQKVFQWKIHEVWQWEQEMYDWSVKTFEKIKKPDTVSVIAVVDDKILVQKQEQPHRDMFLSLPGGKCELGENPQNSASRELLEETGLVAQNIILWKIIPSCYSSIIRDTYYYIAQDCKKVQDLNLDWWEKIQNEYVNFEEFLLLSQNESFRDHDLMNVLLKIRLNPKQKEELKNQLFK